MAVLALAGLLAGAGAVLGGLWHERQRAAGHFGTGRLSSDLTAESRELPTLVVVEGRRVVGRIVSPRGCRQPERELANWLR